MTRPSYDPMRAPAPAFPRHRFGRVLGEDRVNALADVYQALGYEERVALARRVASAPDEHLTGIADELSAPPETPPTEPVPADHPDAPAVNQQAAQEAPAPPVLPVPAEQLPTLTVPELKKVAEDAGLPTTGRKPELVDRLASAAAPPPAPDASLTPAPEAPASQPNAPQGAPEATPGPDTQAAAPAADSGPTAAPAAPAAAPAAGTPTDGGQPA